MAKKKSGSNKPVQRDFVAKYMNEFNHARTHRDRKNDYRRNEKHRKDYDASSLLAFSSIFFLDLSFIW